MTVPSYGRIPEYDVKCDPLYRPDREYGPGHPFVSPAHEAWEANRMRVNATIERYIAEAKKVALAVGYDPRGADDAD